MGNNNEVITGAKHCYGPIAKRGTTTASTGRCSRHGHALTSRHTQMEQHIDSSSPLVLLQTIQVSERNASSLDVPRWSKFTFEFTAQAKSAKLRRRVGSEESEAMHYRTRVAHIPCGKAVAEGCNAYTAHGLMLMGRECEAGLLCG